MYRSGKGSPHSHRTPVDVAPTTAGIPLVLNPLPRCYREFQSHNNNTAILQIPLPCHSLAEAAAIYPPPVTLTFDLLTLKAVSS